jgi:hypothetical protein
MRSWVQVLLEGFAQPLAEIQENAVYIRPKVAGPCARELHAPGYPFYVHNVLVKSRNEDEIIFCNLIYIYI